ncbi:Nucleotidyltransferase domain protein [uncultured archaeon]|nr:Nucleotidyltransferase domain protein [uncultured archaeon]
MKTLETIASIIRDQKPLLQSQFNVKEIGIFGSFVRGEQGEASDLDLLVELEKPIGIIKYVALQNYLSDRTGERVDLVLKSALKPRAGERILREVVFV